MTGQMVKLPEDEDTPEKVSPSSIILFKSKRKRMRIMKAEMKMELTK
jgi:hypothetical protein